MIRSMTGYGGAKGVVEGLNVTVELKSVNNRYLDIAVRMPAQFPLRGGRGQIHHPAARQPRQAGCVRHDRFLAGG